MKPVWLTSTTKIQYSSKNSWQSSIVSSHDTTQVRVSAIKRNSQSQSKEPDIWHSSRMYSRYAYHQLLLLWSLLLELPSSTRIQPQCSPNYRSESHLVHVNSTLSVIALKIKNHSFEKKSVFFDKRSKFCYDTCVTFIFLFIFYDNYSKRTLLCRLTCINCFCYFCRCIRWREGDYQGDVYELSWECRTDAHRSCYDVPRSRSSMLRYLGRIPDCYGLRWWGEGEEGSYYPHPSGHRYHRHLARWIYREVGYWTRHWCIIISLKIPLNYSRGIFLVFFLIFPILDINTSLHIINSRLWHTIIRI